MKKAVRSSMFGPVVVFLCLALACALGIVVIEILKAPSVAVLTEPTVVSTILIIAAIVFAVLAIVFFILCFTKAAEPADDVQLTPVEEEAPEEDLPAEEKATNLVSDVVSTAKDHPVASIALAVAAVAVPVLLVGAVKSASKRRARKQQSENMRNLFNSFFN